MSDDLLEVPWYLRLINRASSQESPEAEAIRHIKAQARKIERLQSQLDSCKEHLAYIAGSHHSGEHKSIHAHQCLRGEFPGETFELSVGPDAKYQGEAGQETNDA